MGWSNTANSLLAGRGPQRPQVGGATYCSAEPVAREIWTSVTDWDTLAAQQPTIAPELRMDWHQKQRQEGNEGLHPTRREENEDVRRVTLKQTEQTATTAEAPPRDDITPRVQPVATEPKEAALLTIGVDPEEARELLGSPVGSPNDLMDVDDAVLDE